MDTNDSVRIDSGADEAKRSRYREHVSWRRRTIAYAGMLGVIIAVLLSVAVFYRPLLLARIEYAVYDRYFNAFSPDILTNIPVIIDIDEKALREVGQWSWPRFEIASLFDKLAEAGVLAVGADYIIADPDRMSPRLWLDSVEHLLGIRPEITNIPPEFSDFDAILADTLRRTPTIVGALLTVDANDVPMSFARSFPIREIREDGAAPLVEYLIKNFESYDGMLSPISEVADVAMCGLMNMESSYDGIFRAMPVCLVHNDPKRGPRAMASLFISTLALAYGNEEITIRVTKDGPVSASIRGPGGRQIEIPIDREGYMIMSLRPLDIPFVRYSAADVLAGRVGSDELNGKIAFFGATATGLSDLRPTPVNQYATSIELYAEAAETVLGERFLRVPSGIKMMHLICIAFLSFVCILLFALAPVWVAFLCVLLLSLGSIFTSEISMSMYGVIITPVFPLITIIFQSAQTLAFGSIFEGNERALLRKAFSNYVSPEVVSRIVSSGDVDRLSGETREISVLFTDIRGFTSMTERMTPVVVAEFLDDYFTPMTRIVRSSGGTVDKFIGDAMMAFWNAPLDVPDHPRAALEALMEMRRTLNMLNKGFRMRLGTTVMMGGGIYTGRAYVGNMGTSELISYTALGDTVNTASRLEGMCKKYGVGIVTSDTAAEACRDLYRIIPLDIVRVKGRNTPVPIFTACDAENAEGRESEFMMWEEAFTLYRSGMFRDSCALCSELVKTHPDVKLYGVFAERTKHMADINPEEWNGVYTHDTK